MASGTMTCVVEEFSFALPDPLLDLAAPDKRPGRCSDEGVGRGNERGRPDEHPRLLPGRGCPKGSERGDAAPVRARAGRIAGQPKVDPQPGLYPGGLDLKGGVTAYLLPGIYWIGGGGFQACQRRDHHLGRQRDRHDQGGMHARRHVPPCTGGGGVLIYNSKLVNAAAGPITMGGNGADAEPDAVRLPLRRLTTHRPRASSRTAPSSLTMTLNGSDSQASDVRGIVYSPLGEVKVNGANSTFTMDQVIAYTFKINGSGGTVKVLRETGVDALDHRHRSRRVAIRSGSRGSGLEQRERLRWRLEALDQLGPVVADVVHQRRHRVGVERRRRRGARAARRSSPGSRRRIAASVAQASGGTTTGIRLWIGAMNAFGRVVTIVNVRCQMPLSGSWRPVHRPASASGRSAGSWIRIGWRDVPVAQPLVEAVDRDEAAPPAERVAEQRAGGDGLRPRVERAGRDPRVVGPARDQAPAIADDGALLVALDDDGGLVRRGDVEPAARVVEQVLGLEDRGDLRRRLLLGEPSAHRRRVYRRRPVDRGTARPAPPVQSRP